MPVLIPMLAVVAAIVLIFYGYRGRRIGEQPVCKKCGFDLSGKPSTSLRCSECGADLGEYDAVAYGQLHRRKGVLVAGLVMFVFFGALAGSKVGTIKTLRYAPFKWVVWRACSSDAELRNAAHVEMDRRVLQKTLSDENWAELANAATAYRADLSMPCDDDWGDLVKEARESHNLKDDRWQKYLRALAHHTFFGEVWHQPPAFTELMHRKMDGLLNPADLAAVDDEMLACQADAGKPWNTEWGDWLADCKLHGQVDAERWKRYLRQSLNGAVKLRLRPQVRLGDPMPLVVQVSVTRAGSAGLLMDLSNVQLQWAGSANPVRLALADSNLMFEGSRSVRIGDPNLDGPVDGSDYSNIDNAYSVPPKDFPAGLAVGTQHVHLTATIQSGPVNTVGAVTDSFDVPGTFELLPTNASSVTIIQVPRAGLPRLIEFPPVLRVSGAKNRTVECAMIVNDPPVGMAFDVILKTGDKSQNIGSFAFPAHADRNRVVLVAPWRLGDVDQVDVTLHSNPAAAANSVDTIEVWDGDIPFTQVPVAFE